MSLPTLAPHQQQIHDFIVSRPFSANWMPIAGGKTLTTLTALQTIRPTGHILVIAPIAIARSTWLNEIEDWQFPIRTKSLIADESDKPLARDARLARYREVFTDPPTMYFINRELISRAPLTSCPHCLGEPKGTRPCLACQTGLVDQMPVQQVQGQESLVWPFPTVIIDEAQSFKSHSSRRFHALRRVRPAITRMIQLTGTPSPNGLEDLWSQIYLLDQGAALGGNITEFRNRWFTPKMRPGTTVPMKWIPTVDAEADIHHRVRHLAMSAENTTLVMPERKILDVRVDLDEDVLETYKEFRRELVLDVVNEEVHQRACRAYETWLVDSAEDEAVRLRARLAAADDHERPVLHETMRAPRLPGFVTDPDEELVHEVIAENEAVLTSKLMQYASGTLYTADPDDPGTKDRYEVIHTEKINATKSILSSAPGPVLLAYHFRSDKEQLHHHLSEAGFTVEVFDGSRTMERRWNQREIPVMLLHPASAGHGLNLQHGGSTLIWYTLPFSLESYLQLNGRLHRPGQPDPVVTIHQLITTGTQDERIPSLLAMKDRTQNNLVRAVRAPDPVRRMLTAELGDDVSDVLTAANPPEIIRRSA